MYEIYNLYIKIMFYNVFSILGTYYRNNSSIYIFFSFLCFQNECNQHICIHKLEIVRLNEITFSNSCYWPYLNCFIHMHKWYNLVTTVIGSKTNIQNIFLLNISKKLKDIIVFKCTALFHKLKINEDVYLHKFFFWHHTQ